VTIVIRMLACLIMIIFFCEQYVKSTLLTSVGPMRDLDIVLILERLLKLSIPNTYVWLMGFYFFFHLWLNFLAEVTRFWDRLFYRVSESM
jgi:diacylglycerol O-acyltransferase-1